MHSSERGAGGWSRVTMLASVVLVVAILYFAREILIPLALAVMLSFVLAPLVLRLQRWGLARIPAIIVVLILSFSALTLIGWVVVGQVIELGNELPKYRHTFVGKLQALNTPTGGAI